MAKVQKFDSWMWQRIRASPNFLVLYTEPKLHDAFKHACTRSETHKSDKIEKNETLARSRNITCHCQEGRLTLERDCGLVCLCPLVVFVCVWSCLRLRLAIPPVFSQFMSFPSLFLLVSLPCVCLSVFPSVVVCVSCLCVSVRVSVRVRVSMCVCLCVLM